LCESQDGPDASVTVLVILNLVIAVTGKGMHVVEGILVPPPPPPLSPLQGGLSSFLAMSVSCRTKIQYTKITPGV
jgi:hypothetical protein